MGGIQGVPRTGSFWHSDYAFMPIPFSISIIYPQVIPKLNRGTYFIDMAEAYDNLSEELKAKIERTLCKHSIRKYFKIRPGDIYKPIGEILQEIQERTPAVVRSTVVTHPISKRKILYVNRGFTIEIIGEDGSKQEEGLLELLFEQSGQKDEDYTNPLINFFQVELGDIVLWDNRRLIHHAKHSNFKEPSKSFRLTIYDGNPFSLEGNHILLDNKINNFEILV